MMFGMRHSRFWRAVAAGVVLSALALPAALKGAVEPSVEELKGRVANATISEQAKAALADVVAFSESARDYAIQSRKHEKKSEIAIRKMTRKLADLKHTVSHEDQEQVQSTIDRLQRVRDDLLVAMFPKVGKK
jgi:hypothetical protein